MLRLSLVCAFVLLVGLVRAQTAAPFPPLVYSYQGQSAPTSLLNAISTAAEPYQSILDASATDTATALVGAFPTTATVADTNTPVAASIGNVYSSGQPGVVLSSNPRAPYTKTGTVATTLSKGTQGTSATGTSGAGKIGYPSSGVIVSCLAGVVGVVAGMLFM
ncbi:hypothetical protein JCM10212_001021 [Sporobolomyces blumeae]